MTHVPGVEMLKPGEKVRKHSKAQPAKKKPSQLKASPSLRAKAVRFIDAFGKDLGSKYFAAGLSYQDATVRYADDKLAESQKLYVEARKSGFEAKPLGDFVANAPAPIRKNRAIRIAGKVEE